MNEDPGQPNFTSLIEPQYRMAMDCLTDGFAICTPIIHDNKITDFKLLYINNAIAKKAEAEKDKLIGKPLSEILLGYKNREFFRLCCESIETGEPRILKSFHLTNEMNIRKVEGYFNLTITSSHNMLVIAIHDITEKLEAKKKIQNITKQLQDIIDSTPNVIFAKDLDGKYIIINHRAEKILGMKSVDITGKKSESDFFSKEKLDFFNSYDQKILKSGKPEQLELEIPIPGNESITILLNLFPLMDENKKPYAICGVATDITERKKIELALQESELRLLETQRLAHIGNFTYDIETGISEWTDETFNIYGCDPQKGVPSFEEILEFIHPDDRTRAIEELNHGMENNEIINSEFRLLLRDNKVKYINKICRPVYDKSGKPTKRIGAVIDITERKLIQIKLEEMLLKLQENEALLLETQKLAHVGNFTYNINTGLSEWTDETFRIHECDPQKGIPIFNEILNFIHPDDRYRVVETINKGKKTGDIISFESRLLLNGNKVKYITYAGRLVYDKFGNPSKRVGAVTDITERKLIELNYEKTLENLERSNKELEQFAYVASHDLQEPLRMISTYTNMLESRYKDKLDDKAREFIWFIVDGAKRMNTLIHDLLTYARLSSREKPFVDTDLNDILTNVLRDLQVEIKDSNTVLEIDKLPLVKADPTQMKQLFQNLIQNAIKFTDKEKPLIKVSKKLSNNEWIFCVSDNGIGIKPEYFEKIFMLFQRLHTQSSYPGTGLGLAICKKIVERHGGRIWVESQVKQGAAFYFSLLQ